MTYELRTYIAEDGKLEDLLSRFREHTLALFSEHGIRSVGYWLAQDRANTLIYLLEHKGDPAANWERFKSDPEWIAVRDRSVENGPLTASIESVYLERTDFSPTV